MVRESSSPSAATNTSAVRLLYWDDDMALGCSERVFFCLWRNRTTTAGVKTLTDAVFEFTKDHAPDVAIITLIESGIKTPEPGAREGLTRLLKHPGGNVVISAVAFEGTGFMAAIVRGVATGLIGLTRQPFPHHVFSNINEIARWFESHRSEIGVCFPAAETIRYEAEFRRLLRVATSAQTQNNDHESGSRLRTHS